MEKKVELLAPAGNMQCLKAAVHAGADAIYVGGNQFGARAYADNFSQEELCEAISYAHLFGVKLYLTLNTLLKDDEINCVFDYVLPFYEAGLDGVIVQDFGVVQILKHHFPDLEIHASTQMTVTGPMGAKVLKDKGICRVVPARELSLEEIADIKNETGMEIETFIHGAMCYSYSGQCLFSSFLGGRSGNRGRCAGPCRLPYDVTDNNQKMNQKNEQYPISLKDLCSLPILPKLMECGINSFKIEGRMKSPEYVAGVTAMYRKYIDFYEKDKENYRVDSGDLDKLRNLYLRGEIETGYYEKHNGRSMVTLQQGNYQNAVSDYSEYIKQKYVDKEKRITLFGKVTLQTGYQAKFEVYDIGRKREICVSTQNTVSEAKNRPMEEEDIKKQLLKTGNTPFVFESVKIIKDENIFISNKELNELRRSALEAWQDKVCRAYKRQYNQVADIVTDKEACEEKKVMTNPRQGQMTVYVMNLEQLEAIIELFNESNPDSVHMGETNLKRIYIPLSLLKHISMQQLGALHAKTEIYISLRQIVRGYNVLSVREILHKFYIDKQMYRMIDGFLLNSLESMGILKEFSHNTDTMISDAFKGKRMMADYGFYSFNEKAAALLSEMGISELTVPFEWSKHELKKTGKWSDRLPMDYIVYGYIPLMESAGCVFKTFKKCQKGQPERNLFLEDRYKKRFCVVSDCEVCQNTIFNSVPLSLHNEFNEWKSISGLTYRLMFTVESPKQVKKIMKSYQRLIKADIKQDKNNRKDNLPIDEYTTGHFRKGVL